MLFRSNSFCIGRNKCRDGDIQTEDKQLIATMLNVCVRTVERIWIKAQEDIANGVEVDVSDQRKGNSGRKKKELGLSRVPEIALNKRKTIRSLSRELGVSRST